MTRTRKSMLAGAAIAAIGLLAATGASYADRSEDCDFGKHGKHHGAGDHGERGVMMFEKFDINSDGTVTRAEIDEARTSRMKGADGNSDNQLSLEEFETVWLEMTRPMMVDRFQDLDEDGDGQVTDAELDRPMSKMFVILDQNEDGSITMAELRSLHDKHKRHGHGEGHGKDHDEDHDDD